MGTSEINVIEQQVERLLAQGIYPIAYAASIHTIEIIRSGKYPQYVISESAAGLLSMNVSGYDLMVLPIPSRTLSSQYVLGRETIENYNGWQIARILV